jgi:hypothetical protein
VIHRSCLILCVFALLAITASASGTVITATGGFNITAVAGTAATGTVATFTDSNTAAMVSDFIAVIDWGDSTTSVGTITFVNNMFIVTGPHTYPTPGTLPVIVTISDAPPGTGTTSVTDTATVSGGMPPTLTKSFADSEIQLFNNTALSFTLTNPNTFPLTGLAFTDTLPPGLVVATTYTIGTCGGGTITAIGGTNTISLSGATLAASATCTFSVRVTGTAIGVLTNTTSTVTSNEAAPGTPATATISVDYLFFFWFFAA